MASRALKTARECIHAQQHKETYIVKQPQPAKRRINQRRQETKISDLILCFTDAAWDKASNQAGLSWTFRDHATSMDHQGLLASDHVSSALMAEVLTIICDLLLIAVFRSLQHANFSYSCSVHSKMIVVS